MSNIEKVQRRHPKREVVAGQNDGQVHAAWDGGTGYWETITYDFSTMKAWADDHSGRTASSNFHLDEKGEILQ